MIPYRLFERAEARIVHAEAFDRLQLVFGTLIGTALTKPGADKITALQSELRGLIELAHPAILLNRKR